MGERQYDFVDEEFKEVPRRVVGKKAEGDSYGDWRKRKLAREYWLRREKHG